MSFADIPTAEIRQDIADTEAEIEKMRREITAFELLGDRMSLFKRDGRVTGIGERQRFIEKLKKILSDRGEPHEARV